MAASRSGDIYKIREGERMANRSEAWGTRRIHEFIETVRSEARRSR